MVMDSRADALVVVFCGLARVHLDGLPESGEKNLKKWVNLGKNAPKQAKNE